MQQEEPLEGLELHHYTEAARIRKAQAEAERRQREEDESAREMLRLMRADGDDEAMDLDGELGVGGAAGQLGRLLAIRHPMFSTWEPQSKFGSDQVTKCSNVQMYKFPKQNHRI